MDERAVHAAHRPAVAGALVHRLRAHGPRLWPAFAGIIIVEARKELMGALPAKAKDRAAPASSPRRKAD
jgi:hypothetical protein